MKRPFLELNDGMVKATIWHEIIDGEKHYNIAFTRLFRENDRWWDGACFQRQDMAALCRLATDADLWISQQRALEDHAENHAENDGAS